MVKLHPSDQHLEHPASGAFSENLWRWLSEDARYETFPGKSGLFPSHMIRDYAKYGFFFQNDPCPLMRQGWLHCAFCPWSTPKWERTDLAAIEHFKESPLCPLLRGFETPNVQSPMHWYEKGLLETTEPMTYRLTAFRGVYGLTSTAAAEGYVAEEEYAQKHQEILYGGLDFFSLEPEFNKYLKALHKKKKDDKFFYKNQVREEWRRQTYGVNWQYVLDPDDASKYGFISMGFMDRVQCVYCKLEIQNWKKGDLAAIKHLQLNPFCPFMMGFDMCNEGLCSQEEYDLCISENTSQLLGKYCSSAF